MARFLDRAELMPPASPTHGHLLARLALALPVLAVAFCPSCDLYECDSGETDRDLACEQVTQAAERKADTCSVARDALGVLCTPACIGSSKDGKYCRGNDEVAACIAAIDQLGCRQFTRANIDALGSCKALMDRLETDCIEARSSGSGSHDDD
jgi:hypothetical protein